MVQLGEITRSRLARWTDKLDLENATPVMLLGVGHDHKSGQLVICVPDEPQFNNALVRDFLLAALRLLGE